MYTPGFVAITPYDIHNCVLFRSSKDNASLASVYTISSTVKYKIGYRSFDANGVFV